MTSPTRKEKIEDIQRVVAELGGISELSIPEYKEAGGSFNEPQIYSGGDTWEALLSELGLEIKSPRKISRDKDYYYQNLALFVKEFGRIPKSSERTKAKLNFPKGERFWPNYTEFVQAAINEGIIKENIVPERYLIDILSDDHEDSNQEFEESIINHGSEKVQRNIGPPPHPKFNLRKNTIWTPIYVPGMPYAPQDENAVIALFAILCSKHILKYQILDLSGGEGIDSLCYDETTNETIRVEFKDRLSKGKWNHNINDLDMVVCWKSSWKDFPKKVIELEKVIKSNDF